MNVPAPARHSMSSSPSGTLSSVFRLLVATALLLGATGCFNGGGSSDTLDGSNQDVPLPDGAECIDGTQQCSDDGMGVQGCENGQLTTAMPCEFGCADGACLDSAVNGSCATPIELELGTAVTGSTDSPLSTHTWNSSCTMDYGFTPSGPETVYTFTLDTQGAVDINVSPITETFFGVYLRTACGDQSTELVGACAGNAAITEDAGFTYVLPSGEYFVIVDDFASQGEGTGDFELLVQSTGVPGCHNQVPQILDLSSGTTTVQGDTSQGNGGTFWNFSDCPSSFETRGAEQIYAFTLLEPGTVTATASPIEPAMSKIGLYMRSDCEDRFSQMACGYGDDMSGTDATFTTDLDPGTYYLFVDDFIGSIDDPQTYELTVTVE